MERVTVSAYILAFVDVACGSTYCLGEERLGVKTLLVGIQDATRETSDKSSLPQEIDPNEDIKQAFAQVLHDFDPFEGIHIAVDIAAAM